jgi:hypothetical protein
MRMRAANGNTIEVLGDGTVLMNNIVATITPLDNGFSRAHVYYMKHKRPKRCQGIRNRRNALKASLKRYKFSTTVRMGN